RAFRGRGLPWFTAAERPDDYRRTGFAEDGAGHPSPLSADARAQMGYIHGRLRYFYRCVQQLRADSGKPGNPDRRVCAGVSAAPGAVDLRADAVAGKDSGT